MSYGLASIDKALSSDKINNKRFREFFGISDSVCAILWLLIESKVPKFFKVEHLFMTLHFLKCYDTESINAALFGVDEKTHRTWQWKLVQIIASLDIVSIKVIIYMNFRVFVVSLDILD